MIERHLTFNVLPEREQDFERFFAEQYRPTMSSTRGFVRVELLREAANDTRYRMMYRYEDDESAAAWRTSREHDVLQPSLSALHAGSRVEAYDVVA
jgi:heme-degrading monooxygenase HmoA